MIVELDLGDDLLRFLHLVLSRHLFKFIARTLFHVLHLHVENLQFLSVVCNPEHLFIHIVFV